MQLTTDTRRAMADLYAYGTRHVRAIVSRAYREAETVRRAVGLSPVETYTHARAVAISTATARRLARTLSERDARTIHMALRD